MQEGCTAAVWKVTATSGITSTTYRLGSGSNYLSRTGSSNTALQLNTSTNYANWMISGNSLRNYNNTSSTNYYLSLDSGSFATTNSSGNSCTVLIFKKTSFDITVSDTTTQYSGNVVLPTVTGDTTTATVKYCMTNSSDPEDWKTAEEASTGFPTALTDGTTVYVAAFIGDKMVGVTSAKVVITKSMIDLPAPKVYVYDNKEKELVIPGFTITGTTKGIEAGEYKAKLALADTNSSEWSATAKGMLNSDGTTIDYCWYIVKNGDSVADGEKAIKPLSLSVYTMDNLDGLSGSDNKMNCIVVAEQTVPDTEATLWTFAPTSTGTTAPKMVDGATGYIFTKYEVDGAQKYYYLGVDGSNNLKAVEKTTEKMTSGDASGITTFYMKADSSTGATGLFLSDKTTKIADIYLRNTLGGKLWGDNQFDEGGSGQIQTSQQKAFYFVKAENGGDTISVDTKTGEIVSKTFDPAKTVTHYYGIPTNPDEIALPLRVVEKTVIGLSNAAVWQFAGSKTSFTLTLVKNGELDTNGAMKSENGNGYHSYRLTTGATNSATSWKFVDGDGTA